MFYQGGILSLEPPPPPKNQKALRQTPHPPGPPPQNMPYPSKIHYPEHSLTKPNFCKTILPYLPTTHLECNPTPTNHPSISLTHSQFAQHSPAQSQPQPSHSTVTEHGFLALYPPWFSLSFLAKRTFTFGPPFQSTRPGRPATKHGFREHLSTRVTMVFLFFSGKLGT